MSRTGGRGNQDRLVVLAMQLFTDGLAIRPLTDCGQRRRQADTAKALVVVEESDMLEVDPPIPQIAGSAWVGGRPVPAKARYHSAQAVSGSSAKYQARTTLPCCQRPSAGSGGR